MQGLLDSRNSPKMNRRDPGEPGTSSSSTSQPPPPPHPHHRDRSRDPSPMFQPDNSCCFCLTLRSGTGIIAGLKCVFYLGILIWYLSLSSSDYGGIRDGSSLDLDLTVSSICFVMVLVNILLMVSAVKEVPCQTLPWLCANTVTIIIAMILIVYIILFGTASPLELNYSEYVTVLSLMGFTTGVTLFCWIVVFTFRKNLLMIAKYSITPTDGRDSSSCPDKTSSAPPSAPPPAYSEIDTTSWNSSNKPQVEPQDEPGPPGYEAVMRQQSLEGSSQQGPVQRKKSLTNHNV